ncbi:hypothetical protein NM688_g7106 [Phlebia brevispora]|uniref:Uncharacterized protein n=1 Tax=Phlebia brevispora TaxID=194682 RepID=A0ACC1S939_9APHY|nr:hypothetical protein NM688_g7106 [Phlebia brevispora]
MSYVRGPSTRMTTHAQRIELRLRPANPKHSPITVLRPAYPQDFVLLDARHSSGAANEIALPDSMGHFVLRLHWGPDQEHVECEPFRGRVGIDSQTHPHMRMHYIQERDFFSSQRYCRVLHRVEERSWVEYVAGS